MRRILNRMQCTCTLSRGRIALLCALSGLQALLQVGMALASRYVIDSALAPDGKLSFWGVVLGADLLLLIGIHTLAAWLTNSSSDKSIARMQHTLLSTATRCSPETLQRYHSGALLSRGLEDIRTVCDSVIRVLPNLTGQVVRLAGALAAVLLICPEITPVFLIAGLTVASIAAGFRGLARKLHRKVRKAEETVTSDLQEGLQQLSLIQSLQIEEPILLRFRDKLDHALRAKHTRRFWTVGVNSVISSLSLIGTGALLLWGAVQVANGSVSYGVLTAMVQLLTLFRGPLLGISGSWTQLAAADVADARLQELLCAQASPSSPADAAVRVHAVVFRNVTFRYPTDTQPVLTDFSAEFPLDRWTCLTGTSGIGKTTLFKLILGLYPPQEGRVYLKTDKGEMDCSPDTRHLFAYVPQDYALFSGTVLENMQLVAPDANEAQRKKAYQLAGADFVWQLSDAENAQVLENNTGLSMGQLQRLAIARSILMERPIFLLDECTSALDAETEAAVLANLHNLGKQAIVVTHHPEVLDDTGSIKYVDM